MVPTAWNALTSRTSGYFLRVSLASDWETLEFQHGRVVDNIAHILEVLSLVQSLRRMP